jgi:hypothetical protein
MSKTAKRLLAGALAGILLTAGLGGCGVNRKELPGSIAFLSAPADAGCGDGILLYTPASREWETLLTGDYGSRLCWHPDKTRVLSQKQREPNGSNIPILFEYDLSAGTVTELLDLDTVEGLKNINFCYVPGSYDVSFVAEDRVKVLNRETGEILDRTGPLSSTTIRPWLGSNGTRFFTTHDAGHLVLTIPRPRRTMDCDGWNAALSPTTGMSRTTALRTIDDPRPADGRGMGVLSHRSGLGGVLQKYTFSPTAGMSRVGLVYGLGGSSIDYRTRLHETGDKIKQFKGGGSPFACGRPKPCAPAVPPRFAVFPGADLAPTEGTRPTKRLRWRRRLALPPVPSRGAWWTAANYLYDRYDKTIPNTA